MRAAVHAIFMVILFAIFAVVPCSFVVAAPLSLVLFAYIHGSKSSSPDGEMSEGAGTATIFALTCVVASLVNLLHMAVAMVAHKY